jgi:CheY-like chemotaxis protein
MGGATAGGGRSCCLSSENTATGLLEASNRIAALELLEAEKNVRLLFTDVGLPGGLNRWQLANKARRRRQDLQPATHETPSFIKGGSTPTPN